jgi:hypothetical protein
VAVISAAVNVLFSAKSKGFERWKFAVKRVGPIPKLMGITGSPGAGLMLKVPKFVATMPSPVAPGAAKAGR